MTGTRVEWRPADCEHLTTAGGECLDCRTRLPETTDQWLARVLAEAQKAQAS